MLRPDTLLRSFNALYTITSHLVGWLEIMAPAVLALHDEECHAAITAAVAVFDQARNWAK